MSLGFTQSLSRVRSIYFLSGRWSTGLTRAFIPFRKATNFDIHVSGGEFNVAANLSDCFRLKTWHRERHGELPDRDLINGVVREMGVKSFYKNFEHDGVRGPNMATVYSDQGLGRSRSGGLLQPQQRGGGDAEAGRLRLEGDLRQRRALVPLGRHLLVALGVDPRSW